MTNQTAVYHLVFSDGVTINLIWKNHTICSHIVTCVHVIRYFTRLMVAITRIEIENILDVIRVTKGTLVEGR